MIKKFLAALAAIALGLGLAPAPASAAALHGCADDSICLYYSPWYQNGKWQSSFYNLSTKPNGCLNLNSPAAYFSNGQKVWDNSASLVVNATGSYSHRVYLSVFDWPNCNGNGPFNSYPAHIDTALDNLDDYGWQDGDMRNRIVSIRIRTL